MLIPIFFSSPCVILFEWLCSILMTIVNVALKKTTTKWLQKRERVKKARAERKDGTGWRRISFSLPPAPHSWVTPLQPDWPLRFEHLYPCSLMTHRSLLPEHYAQKRLAEGQKDFRIASVHWHWDVQTLNRPRLDRDNTLRRRYRFP